MTRDDLNRAKAEVQRGGFDVDVAPTTTTPQPLRLDTKGPWVEIDDPAEQHRRDAGHSVARMGHRWTCEEGDAGDPSLYADLFDPEAFTS